MVYDLHRPRLWPLVLLCVVGLAALLRFCAWAGTQTGSGAGCRISFRDSLPLLRGAGGAFAGR